MRAFRRGKGGGKKHPYNTTVDVVAQTHTGSFVSTHLATRYVGAGGRSMRLQILRDLVNSPRLTLSFLLTASAFSCKKKMYKSLPAAD